MNAHGRIVVCGMIADCCKAQPSAGPNWLPIIKKRLTIEGFAMPDHFGEVPARVAKPGSWVMADKFKHRAHVL